MNPGIYHATEGGRRVCGRGVSYGGMGESFLAPAEFLALALPWSAHRCDECVRILTDRGSIHLWNPDRTGSLCGDVDRDAPGYGEGRHFIMPPAALRRVKGVEGICARCLARHPATC